MFERAVQALARGRLGPFLRVLAALITLGIVGTLVPTNVLGIVTAAWRFLTYYFLLTLGGISLAVLSTTLRPTTKTFSAPGSAGRRQLPALEEAPQHSS